MVHLLKSYMRGGPDLTVAAHPGHSNRHATESKRVLEERFGAGPTTFGVYYIYIYKFSLDDLLLWRCTLAKKFGS